MSNPGNRVLFRNDDKKKRQYKTVNLKLCPEPCLPHRGNLKQGV